MKRFALILTVFCLIGLCRHHRHARACDSFVGTSFVGSSYCAAPAFAYAQPVLVATPFVSSYGFSNVNVVAVNNRRANVQVNAVGADVRVRRGAFGSTVVRVR